MALVQLVQVNELFQAIYNIFESLYNFFILVKYSISPYPDCNIKSIWPGIFYSSNRQSKYADGYSNRLNQFDIFIPYNIKYRREDSFYPKEENSAIIEQGKLHLVSDNRKTKKIEDCMGKIHTLKKLPKVYNGQTSDFKIT